MSDRFIKFIPSEEAFWLMEEKPNAFRLLTHIANRARLKNGHVDGLMIGQCHLQHWSKYKFTEREYRTAKQILLMRKHIIIIETNRTRQKSTTGSTTGSTLVQLISSTVYDIGLESIDDRIDDRETTDRRPRDDKQEVYKNTSSYEEDIQKEVAQSAKRLRSKDFLSFDFEKWEYTGITEKDIADWRMIYPHIDVAIEGKKSIEWLKANPSRNKKKNWRKFLTGWFGRSDEKIENKKAFTYASGKQNIDRRSKDIEGKPFENPYEGKF